LHYWIRIPICWYIFNKQSKKNQAKGAHFDKILHPIYSHQPLSAGQKIRALFSADRFYFRSWLGCFNMSGIVIIIDNLDSDQKDQIKDLLLVANLQPLVNDFYGDDSFSISVKIFDRDASPFARVLAYITTHIVV
jgi:hypothetical protein